VDRRCRAWLQLPPGIDNYSKAPRPPLATFRANGGLMTSCRVAWLAGKPPAIMAKPGELDTVPKRRRGAVPRRRFGTVSNACIPDSQHGSLPPRPPITITLDSLEEFMVSTQC